MDYDDAIARLRGLSNPEAVAGMARFGINPERTLGISVPNLRRLAREAKRDHGLALRLWASGIHEARILASMVDDPKQVTEEQAEQWARDFDSWDVCDQCCMNLFFSLPFAHRKALEWAGREEEFVKRAGFALMACLAWKDRGMSDGKLTEFFPAILAAGSDNRNFVKKSVNWALRQIGKRNRALNQMAIGLAREMQKLDSRPARWIASDALRELTGDPVQARLPS